MIRIRVGVATDVGRVRQHNEDSVLAERDVFVVADGLGGHAAGDVASGIVVSTLAELTDLAPRRPQDIVASLTKANRGILASAARHREQTGMGTTATGLTLVSEGGSQYWAVFNVGDSRVYRWFDGDLTLLTVDHSEVRELVDAGVITEEEAASYPWRNIVTRALGTAVMPDVDLWVLAPQPGERFVICSDGLTNELPPEAMASIVSATDDPQAAAEALVRAALEAGGRDNVSVIVVHHESDGPSPTSGE